MALGTPAYFAGLIRSVLPRTWFPDNSPVLNGILSGPALMWSTIFDQLTYVYNQARVATASGDSLDIISVDFLGDRLPRQLNELDTTFRIRIRREILRAKVTRQALSDNLYEITGHRPILFEPGLPSDAGGLNTNAFAFNDVGGWGSRTLPYQGFVTVFQPPMRGPPNVSGWNSSAGGWGVGNFALQDHRTLYQGVTADIIRETVVDTVSAGTVVWLRIRPFTEAKDFRRLDIDFFLDDFASQLS